MANNKKIAIVTDGLWRKSLSAIRALGNDGYEVIVMGDSLATTGFWSRFTARRVIAPTAKNNSETFGEALVILLRSLKSKPVLFPMEDDTVIWCSKNAKLISQYAHIALPQAKSLDIAMDKSKTMLQAKKVGIPHPETWIPKSFEEFVSIINSSSSEVVVKPVRGSGSHGMVYDTQKSMVDWRIYWDKYSPVVVQERIPADGEALGVSVLMDHANCVAAFAHKRLQQYPNSGGPSTDRIAIEDKKITQLSIKLLESLNWHGVAMVEWKVDPNTKKAKLLEINPRFWGSLELAVRSGVDFPVLYAKLARGERISPVKEYKFGTRCRWLIPGEILRYLSQKPANRESLSAFANGLPASAEEWDRQDIQGFISTVICTFIQAFDRENWKFLRRK